MEGISPSGLASLWLLASPTCLGDPSSQEPYSPMDGGPSVERLGPEHGSLHWPVPGETKQCSIGEQQAGSHAGLGQGGGTWVGRSREG